MELGELWRGLEHTGGDCLVDGEEGTDPRWASGVSSPRPTIFFMFASKDRAESLRTTQNVDTSGISVPSLGKGHGNLFSIIPILVHVLLN